MPEKRRYFVNGESYVSTNQIYQGLKQAWCFYLLLFSLFFDFCFENLLLFPLNSSIKIKL